jgi:hypothetical protein
MERKEVGTEMATRLAVRRAPMPLRLASLGFRSMSRGPTDTRDGNILVISVRLSLYYAIYIYRESEVSFIVREY